MTIFLGDAVLSGDQVQIAAPAGFGAVDGVRLTNYTGDVLILNDIAGQDQSREYLMPLQQMVYHTRNVSRIPTVQGIALGTQIFAAALLVEWSTDAKNDFIGTYPAQVVAIPSLQNPAFAQVGVLALPLVGTSYTVPANPQRQSITFVNKGPTSLVWRTNDTTWGSNLGTLAPLEGASLNSTTALFFRTLAVNGVLEWFSD